MPDHIRLEGDRDPAVVDDAVLAEREPVVGLGLDELAQGKALVEL